ncbi:hypothetical protein [Aquimarina aquimarini]|uniref:hypothetical protein n=1 Tax=Aquimarina aquimarini TaxID=1191734 RepID=UPI001F3BD678|nr:hypothetical protein [Aquimarina aquimarini]
MSSWLAKIRPPKYLRYFFYIAYSWYRSHTSERNEAHYTAAIIIGGSKAIIVLLLLSVFFTDAMYINGNKNQWLFLVFSIAFIVFYYLFIYKKKWRSYIDEFSYLKRQDRRRGTIYLFLYLFTIFFILFPLCIYIMVQNSPYYK